MLIRRGLILNNLSNSERLGAMPSLQQNSADIKKPDLRQLERNLRKIDGVSRKAAKKLCNQVRNVDWQKNLDERDAERKAQMHDYLAPQRDAEAKLKVYSKALCDAELQLLDEYESMTNNSLKYDYYLIHKNSILGKYNNEH